jgi:hypothetical protein
MTQTSSPTPATSSAAVAWVTCHGTDCYTLIHRAEDGRMHDATGPHTCEPVAPGRN